MNIREIKNTFLRRLIIVIVLIVLPIYMVMLFINCIAGGIKEFFLDLWDSDLQELILKCWRGDKK